MARAVKYGNLRNLDSIDYACEVHLVLYKLAKVLLGIKFFFRKFQDLC